MLCIRLFLLLFVTSGVQEKKRTSLWPPMYVIYLLSNFPIHQVTRRMPSNGYFGPNNKENEGVKDFQPKSSEITTKCESGITRWA